MKRVPYIGASLIWPDWTRQESGWWTHPDDGGLCLERDGWYLYPLEGDRRGPFLTMRAAVASLPRNAPLPTSTEARP
jgi:hypothetical protein